MLLSIILPMYNVEQYVDRCIRSLENQDIDKDDYEILVIDDGSPDNSASIVEKLQTEFSNITIYHKLNGGLSSARNYGIERAQGKYCWFVDSDDYLEKNVLKTLLYQLETHELDYVGFNLYDVIQGKKCKGTEWREKPSNVMSGTEYIKSAPIVKSACVHILKTDIYKKNNLRFVEGIIHEDYEFMLRIYRFCNRMKFLELPVYNYVIRESGS
ncbi:glycosyltransferase family 2 protein, partial [Bacteroides thetaiotaomicron]